MRLAARCLFTLKHLFSVFWKQELLVYWNYFKYRNLRANVTYYSWLLINFTDYVCVGICTMSFVSSYNSVATVQIETAKTHLTFRLVGCNLSPRASGGHFVQNMSGVVGSETRMMKWLPLDKCSVGTGWKTIQCCLATLYHFYFKVTWVSVWVESIFNWFSTLSKLFVIIL